MSGEEQEQQAGKHASSSRPAPYGGGAVASTGEPRTHRGIDKAAAAAAAAAARVRVEIMGSQQCGIVGKSQPGLVMIDPVNFTRARAGWLAGSGGLAVVMGVSGWLIDEHDSFAAQWSWLEDATPGHDHRCVRCEPGRFHPQILDKNMRGIGKSQSK
jgi:hypothetical protein